VSGGFHSHSSSILLMGCHLLAVYRIVCPLPTDGISCGGVFAFYLSCMTILLALEMLPRRQSSDLLLVEKQLLLHVGCRWLGRERNCTFLEEFPADFIVVNSVHYLTKDAGGLIICAAVGG
jgi:hypothetical protein